MATAMNTEKVPGGDRVVKKITKLHVSKRTVRRVLDEVEIEAGSPEHATELLVALSGDNTLLPESTRQSLGILLNSNCILEVLTIKARPFINRLNCFAP